MYSYSYQSPTKFIDPNGKAPDPQHIFQYEHDRPYPYKKGSGYEGSNLNSTFNCTGAVVLMLLIYAGALKNVNEAASTVNKEIDNYNYILWAGSYILGDKGVSKAITDGTNKHMSFEVFIDQLVNSPLGKNRNTKYSLGLVKQVKGPKDTELLRSKLGEGKKVGVSDGGHDTLIYYDPNYKYKEGGKTKYGALMERDPLRGGSGKPEVLEEGRLKDIDLSEYKRFYWIKKREK